MTRDPRLCRPSFRDPALSQPALPEAVMAGAASEMEVLAIIDFPAAASHTGNRFLQVERVLEPYSGGVAGCRPGLPC